MKNIIFRCAVFSGFLFCCIDAVHLSVMNNGPVVWGSNITFEGVLSHVIDASYEWIWDDGSHTVKQNAHLQTRLVKSYQQPGNYTMTVIVRFLFFRIAQAAVQFRILATIPGELLVYQGNVSIPPGHYISTREQTYLYTKLYDPGGVLANVTLFYWWYIDSVLVDSKSSNLSYVFNSSKDYRILVFVNAYNQFRDIRWASFSYLARARDPIRTINATGNTVLRRGDLVDLIIECDGSYPWVYCWKAIENGNSTLQNVSCSNTMTTNDCEFRTIWYFKHTGFHKILINISNDINRLEKLLVINILNGVPEPQLSTVIIPIVGSLLAVTIIVVGVLYFIQTRHRFTIEVADFDFTNTDSLVYRTFSEQLKDAIVNAFPLTRYSQFERNWNFLDCCADTDSLSASNCTIDTKVDDSDSSPSPIQ